MTETTSTVMTHLTLGAVIVYGIQYLKAAGWMPWLTADSKTLTRLVSALAALAVGFGVTGQWDPVHGGTFVIPPLSDLINGLWDTVKQFTTNQVLYDTVFNRPAVPVQVTVAHMLPSSLPQTDVNGVPTHGQP